MLWQDNGRMVHLGRGANTNKTYAYASGSDGLLQIEESGPAERKFERHIDRSENDLQ